MAPKIDFDAIIETCTQEEILDLLKRKMIKNVEDLTESIKKQMTATTSVIPTSLREETSQVILSKPSTKVSTETESPKRRGRPAKKTAASTKKESGGESKQNLGDLIVQALGKNTLKIEQILEKVHALGWNTKSSNPRTLISQELSRLVKKGLIEKAERGSYKKA